MPPMLHKPSRRGFITGLVGLVAAPAVIRVADLMPIKPYKSTIGLHTIPELIEVGLDKATRLLLEEAYEQYSMSYNTWRSVSLLSRASEGQDLSAS